MKTTRTHLMIKSKLLDKLIISPPHYNIVLSPFFSQYLHTVEQTYKSMSNYKRAWCALS